MVDEALTRERAQAVAGNWANDASTVRELVHEAFNADTECGGYAFVCDRGVFIAAFNGARSWSIHDGPDGAGIAQVEQFWADAQHRNRPLDLEGLSPLHRAVVAALVAGVASVSELPAEARAPLTAGRRAQGRDADDVDPIARADYLLVFLARFASEPTQEAALKAFAANDWLLAAPTAVHQQAHRCPICGKPAIGGPRYVTAVCDACYPLTTCSHGRLIAGNNLSLSGGFEARHVDDEGVCDQATADHRCWIGNRECRIAEAYMGGVVVTAPPEHP